MTSIVIQIGKNQSECGYCHRDQSTFIAEGLYAYQITPTDYQKLINQRWRRAGHYIYQPVLEATCCNLQTIRLDCSKFQLTKSQRKCLKRFLHNVDLEIPKDTPRIEFLDATLRLIEKCTSFSCTLQPATLTDEAFDLYRRYQVTIHGDSPEDVNLDSFKRFLCESPIIARQTKAKFFNQQLSYGSYHLYYRVGGRLMAISVVDILSESISSVYLFYDPDYREFSWGTLSALLEIGFIQDISKSLTGLHYYYLGYYLPDCSKMAYKTRFKPFQLLNPVTLQWEEKEEEDS